MLVKFMDVSFLGELVMSHFINLYITMVFQYMYLESNLHTLVVATLDKLSGCQEQPLLNGMHKMSEPVYCIMNTYSQSSCITCNTLYGW